VFVGTGPFWSLVIGILISVIAVVFVLQNSDKVDVKFLWWEGNVSLAGIILLTIVATVIADELFGLVLRRRRRRRLTEEERRAQR
jgi:uncharacterized integral membrane protein